MTSAAISRYTIHACISGLLPALVEHGESDEGPQSMTDWKWAAKSHPHFQICKKILSNSWPDHWFLHVGDYG